MNHRHFTRAALLLVVTSAATGRAAPAGAAPAAATSAPAVDWQKAPKVDHVVKDIDGKEVKLASYRGKALLVVNVASQCGYTPQYANLQKLYETYKDRGLVVLGFPSNDFGGQEPGTGAEIKAFATKQFHVTFPLFEKVKTLGPDKAPLYKTLTEQTPDPVRGDVKWNFTKFLVDMDGNVVARFDSKVDPLAPEVVTAVERALPKKG